MNNLYEWFDQESIKVSITLSLYELIHPYIFHKFDPRSPKKLSVVYCIDVPGRYLSCLDLYCQMGHCYSFFMLLFNNMHQFHFNFKSGFRFLILRQFCLVTSLDDKGVHGSLRDSENSLSSSVITLSNSDLFFAFSTSCIVQRY